MVEHWDSLLTQKTVLAIMGPTASGKSRLSMALADCLPMEIISVDSALIYRGMDIGTAKPTLAEQARVPHHLIDILDPHESYSASAFVQDTHRLVEEIFARGNLPVMVGGTMMYFNALQQGMNALPQADEAIRQALQQQWLAAPDSLHTQLAEVDAVAAKRIHPNDPQRLIRALEVYLASGKSLTEWQQAPTKQALSEFCLHKVGLIAQDRARLHQQIEQRFMQMMAQGFLSEVELLFQNPRLNADLPSIRSVGYRQAWSYLCGEIDGDELVQKGVAATRQLAKRQLTWLRKEQALQLIDPFETLLDEQVQQICQRLHEKVLSANAERLKNQNISKI
ncbi:MAG: tRNA (adenosine(37)-N6)-dimethylallyltransferase MiaA [Thiotrichales bacterium]|nr:tRNA (adenosine(37)-N6)-dimethylallyltransferase MiaA [Thiotrichales bacterium]